MAGIQRDRHNEGQNQRLKRVKAGFVGLDPGYQREFLEWVCKGETSVKKRTGNTKENLYMKAKRKGFTARLMRHSQALGLDPMEYRTLAEMRRAAQRHYRRIALETHDDVAEQPDPERMHEAKRARDFFKGLANLPIDTLVAFCKQHGFDVTSDTFATATDWLEDPIDVGPGFQVGKLWN